MKVIIWGSRGSIPASAQMNSMKNKILKALEAAQEYTFQNIEDIKQFVNDLPFSVVNTYGSNTSCVEIRDGDEYIIFDSGTGIRDFGNYVMSTGKQNCIFHIFMSHVHWDHIQGFPFFVPAFIPGNKIHFYGFHNNIKEAMISQQNEPNFPVPYDFLNADIDFTTLDLKKEYKIAGYKIKGLEQNHPGKSYGYSFEKNSKKIVYSTDSEHDLDNPKELLPFEKFFKDADLLIFDAQYSLMDVIQMKKNWGHSSNIVGLELSVKANVKQFCMFHTEPTCDDETLDELLNETKMYRELFSEKHPLNISLAYDGMEIEV